LNLSSIVLTEGLRTSDSLTGSLARLLDRAGRENPLKRHDPQQATRVPTAEQAPVRSVQQEVGTSILRDSAVEPPLDCRGPRALGLLERHINSRSTRDRHPQPVPASFPNNTGWHTMSGGSLQDFGDSS
jgi:hypothetical protein